MSLELLSHWVAEVGSHGFDGFAEAHAWATGGRRQGALATLRELSALACVEVDWRGRRWGAVAPCLTLLPDAAGHALVVGARTARLTRELTQVTEELEVVVIPTRQDRAPDALYVAADSATVLEEMAASLAIPYVHSVVERLTGVLPDLDAQLSTRGTHPIVRHYGLERYDLHRGWQPAEREQAAGLHRYERSGPRAIHFNDGGGGRFDVDLGLGAWAEARRLGIDDLLWWRPDGVNGTLDVPRYLPLPALQARAATLCSGLVATYDDGAWLYDNVPEWVAQRIAESVGQQLVIQ